MRKESHSSMTFKEVRMALSLQKILHCFSFGLFATCAQYINQQPSSLHETVAAMLEKGDNIEKGHYMERYWFTLFSNGL